MDSRSSAGLSPLPSSFRAFELSIHENLASKKGNLCTPKKRENFVLQKGKTSCSKKGKLCAPKMENETCSDSAWKFCVLLIFHLRENPRGTAKPDHLEMIADVVGVCIILDYFTAGASGL